MHQSVVETGAYRGRKKEKLSGFLILSTLLVKMSTYGYFFTIVLLLAPKIVGPIDYLCGLYNKSEMLYFFFIRHYDSPLLQPKLPKKNSIHVYISFALYYMLCFICRWFSTALLPLSPCRKVYSDLSPLDLSVHILI